MPSQISGRSPYVNRCAPELRNNVTRTYNLLINSQLRYHCATRKRGPRKGVVFDDMVNRSGVEPETFRLKVGCSTNRAHGPCRRRLPS